MAGPVHCSCGAILVAGVATDGVTLVSGEFVRFTRKTDFVVCESCHLAYNVRDLLPKSGATPDEIENLERRLAEPPEGG